MFRKLLASCGVAACGLLAAPALAQQPSFQLVVRAPNELRAMLERHLELRRYQQVTDLDDAEISRLLVLAEKDARELLATQGHFVPTIRITREGANPPTLVVEVEPGPVAKISGVELEFMGDIATSTERDAVTQREGIRKDWSLPAGQGFTQQNWQSAKANAMRALLARRYPAAQIADSLADIDASTQRVGLGVKLDSGAVFHLGPMRVTGIERYDPVLLPRLARLAEGSIYDQERIVQAQLRLTGSGYFDSAFIFIDPQSDPAAAPVQVTVREAPLQKVVLGLGFSTDGGARASVEHTHNRFPVVGWRAVTKLQAEQKSPFAQTEWTSIPGEDGWRWAVQARGERLDDDRLVTLSQRLRLGRLRAEDRIDRNVYVQYEHTTTLNPRNVVLSPLETGAGSAVSANYVWQGRYFNDKTYPTAGHGLGFELGAGLTLAGDHSIFQRTLLRGLQFRPLEHGRLQFRAELGAVFARKAALLPATQLFRTGGDTTVRGYRFQEIGIPLPGGVVGPGRYLAVGSVEWQRPLPRWAGLEHTVFVDAGAVADRVGELHPQAAVGTGARYRSPVGPLDVAIAYGIKTRKFRLHFNAGFLF